MSLKRKDPNYMTRLGHCATILGFYCWTHRWAIVVTILVSKDLLLSSLPLFSPSVECYQSLGIIGL